MVGGMMIGAGMAMCSSLLVAVLVFVLVSNGTLTFKKKRSESFEPQQAQDRNCITPPSALVRFAAPQTYDSESVGRAQVVVQDQASSFLPFLPVNQATRLGERMAGPVAAALGCSAATAQTYTLQHLERSDLGVQPSARTAMPPPAFTGASSAPGGSWMRHNMWPTRMSKPSTKQKKK